MLNLFKNSLITLVTNVVNLLIGFWVIRVLSSHLGPITYGQYTLVVYLPTLITSVLSFGVHTATVYHYNDERFTYENVFTGNLLASTAISFGCVAAGLGAIIAFKGLFFETIPTPTLLLALLSIPFYIFNRNFEAIFVARKEIKIYNAVLLSERLANGVLLIVLLDSPTLHTAVIIYLTSLASNTVIILLFLRRFGRVRLSVNQAYFRLVFTFGWKDQAMTVITMLNYRVGVYFIGAMLSDKGVGIFTLPVSLVEKIWLLTNAVGLVLFSEVASAKSDNEKEHITAKASRIVGALTLFGGAALYSLAPFVLLKLFSAEYAESVAVLRIMMPGIVLWGQGKIILNSFAARGKPGLVTFASGAGLITNIMLMLLLIPIMDINGAALASTVSYSLMWVMCVLLYKKHTSTPIGELLILKKSDIVGAMNIIQKFLRKPKHDGRDIL